MSTLYLLLVIPMIWPFIAKYIWKHEISPGEILLNILIVVIIIISTWALSTSSTISDTEILNGQITEKVRDHGTYMESYSCRCRSYTTGSGNNRRTHRKCDTCYRKHYTVKWYLNSTCRDSISIASRDRTSSSVYTDPDPDRYINSYVGEPCSSTHGYDNYVKGVPDSLFRKVKLEQFEKYIPNYPKIFDIYKVNRVLNVGTNIPSNILENLNKINSDDLRELGPNKQVNIIYILTNISDPNYRYAVESKWLGGKKNDVIILIGLDNFNILWNDVITFGNNKNNQELKVVIRDSINDIKNFDEVKISNIVKQNSILGNFKRIEMKEFEYLKDDIAPPTWLVIVLFLVGLSGSIVLSFIFSRN